MQALSGLLGEEDQKLSEEQAAVDSSHRRLQHENLALRKMMHNVTPFAHGDRIDEDAAEAVRSRLAKMRELLYGGGDDDDAPAAARAASIKEEEDDDDDVSPSPASSVAEHTEALVDELGRGFVPAVSGRRGAANG